VITFQYFDGCPNARVTLDNLLEVTKELGTAETDIQIVKVPDPAQAEVQRFQGSPTILVDGRDITTGEVPDGFSYTCRVYSFGGKATGVIPKEFIRQRLAEHERDRYAWWQPGGRKMPSVGIRRERSDPRELTKYKKEYAEKRRRQTASLIPVGVLGATAALGGGGLLGLSEQTFLVIVGAVILSFFGFSLLNWRCPSCGAYLGQRLNPRECKACGTVLRD